MSD
ncbi:hypothetical protein Ga0076813_11536, partial [endosymbiont of Ridgeia piscesae]|jgi:hypothetical protein